MVKTRIKQRINIDWQGNKTVLHLPEARMPWCWIWYHIGQEQTTLEKAQNIIDWYLEEIAYGTKYIKYPEEQ